jgi:hypothetical protein
MASNPQLRRVCKRLLPSGGSSAHVALLAVSRIAASSGLHAAAQLASLRGSKALHETDFLTTATESPQISARFVRKPSRETTLDPNVRVA